MLPPTRLLARLLLLLVTLLSLPAFAQDTPDAYAITPMSTSWVELHGHRYSVEIAQTPAQRERGLMFRNNMADDRGMLFIHDVQEPQAYWMKNTLIALDIFYFDSDRRLVSVSRRTPPCTLGNACPPYRSEGPALYVLELNSGVADRLHAKKGDRLTFAPDIPATPATTQP
jgi:uncharacterized membrane protein (UPF0127 family)